MRSLLGVLFFAAFFAGAAHAEGIEIKKAQVGEELILDFKGNKKSLHRWRFIRDVSRGLELLEVSELGWILSNKIRKSAFSAEDVHRYRILPKAEGQADLVFQHNYRSMRGTFLFKRKTIRIIIHPKAAPPKVVN